jgi:ketosteroid isomerase-like protein
MSSAVAPSVVQAFYLAYVSRDPARIAPFLAEDVDWFIAGPVDVFAFCGRRSGRAAVMELFERQLPAVFDAEGFDPEVLLIDGDRAAMFSRLSGAQRGTGRVIRYHCAQLVRFRENKVVSFRSVIDSFGAAEQALGHAIEVFAAPADGEVAEPLAL